MSEDAVVLQAVWMSGAAQTNSVQATAARVLDRDEADRRRDRRLRIVGATAMVLLVPVLIWATVYGVAPLVRVAYALMAAGCVAGVTAEWLYLAWGHRALPGPDDTRSQLQRTAFMLDSQMWLAKTTALWSAPVFAGVLLISVWLYRGHVAQAVAIGAVGLAAWIGSGILARRAAAELDRRRRQLEDVLRDLRDEAPCA